MGSCKLFIDPRAILLAALLLLILPVKWIVGFALAVIWHELSHLFVLFIVGIPVYEIRIGINGMMMDIPQLSTGKEFVSAVAGPLGGLLLLLFYRWFPELSLCALIQSVYNMLPVYPLDGGRVFRCIVKWIFPMCFDTICYAVEIMTAGCIVCLGLALNLWILSAFVLIRLVCKLIPGKIPCKLG